MNASILFLALAFLAGAMIPFQSAMNTALGKQLQSPYFSALTVFIIAALGVATYILLSRSTVPTAAQFAAAPQWVYLRGLLGGTYILLIVICAPKLGIGNVTVMVLLGQILAAMIIDHFGLLGAVVHQINWQRLVGIFLMIAGVFLIKTF